MARGGAHLVHFGWMRPGPADALDEFAEIVGMGATARQFYLRNFTAEENYEALMCIYRKLLPV